MKNALLLTLALLVACGDGGSTGPVPDPISIATSSLPEGTVGVSYSMVLAASGGTGAYAWSVSSGALPAGLTLAANGAISGTPGTAGTSGFTVQATSGKQSATRGLSVNIQAPEVVITTGTLPGGSVGTAYSQTLAASGGSGGYAWTVASGALPAGLTLSAGGLLSGTPTASGASSFTVQVTSGARTATKSFALTIAFPAVGVTTTSLPDGTVGAAYEQILAASGGSGTYTWALTSGTLPAGLTLYASGTISGTPTAAGTSSFTVQAVSGTASAAKALTITVAQPAVTIATATLPDAEVGAAYNQTLTASGGLGSYTWTIASQSPPPGLTLSAAGVLSGTPTTAGTYTFSVRAVSGGQAEKSYTIIVQPPPVSITSGPALKVAVQNAPYADTLRAAGGTGSYTWSRTTGSLPAGLNLSGGGVISGTPTTQGTSTFTVQVTSGNRTASKDLTITVQPPTVTITTTTLAAGVVGDPYSQQLTATGGAGTVTWSLVSGSSLPPGLTLSSTGLITGTPGTQGTSTFTVRATSGAQEATRALSIVIGSAVPLVVISTAALPGGNVGEAYAATLAATGGTGVYVWSLASADTLPSGLALSVSGQIAGTPARQGTSSFTVQVVSGTRTATMSLSITIGAALPDVLITTTTLPEGTVGTSYGQQLAATGGNGTYTWSRSSGDALPAGLTLSASGLLSGTPTVAGTSTFTVQASSGSRSDTQQLSITIAFAPVSITTASPLSNGMVNVAYSRQLAASGGTGTFTWALASGSSLPGGLGLSAGGLLSGTPTTAGSFNFTVQATSGAVSAAKAFALTIDAVPAVTVTTTTLSNA
ncbi:MAG: autotransporter outer membrane beta-barrel domain-containing protein, partial [Gemmatimonadetes bacterium]|nr:autotransporter outer membrane beta-barrel domain-containing protein [Gemmatimonadota bacterium]